MSALPAEPFRAHDYQRAIKPTPNRETPEQPIIGRVSLSALVEQLKRQGLNAEQILESITAAEVKPRMTAIPKRVWELLKQDLAEVCK